MKQAFDEKLRMLQKLKSNFSEDAIQQRLLLLKMLARLKPNSAQSLIQYHDFLLYISAFPDSGKLSEKATEELLRLKRILSNQGKKNGFHNSGLEFTTLIWKPSLVALQWLLSYSKDLRYTVKSKKTMEEITTMLCAKTEWDSLLDANVSFLQWMNHLSGKQGNTSAHLLKAWLNRFQKLNSSPAVRDFLFESLSLKSTCTLNGNWSLTSNKLLFGQPYFHQQKSEIKKEEIFKPVFLNDKISARILNSIKAALFARQKETDPVTYADEQLLQGYESEDGFTVYLLSMKPEYRLPLESYIGYMVYSNGIPVGYGGGWIFYERCEFGINIFEQFRGGPSARILNVLMNVYKHQYGIKTFVIPPYQFGEGNRDGIKSGAFWFYYKMGFRPVNKELKLLAEREWKKIQHHKTYHSPEKILFRFTESPLFLEQNQIKMSVPEPKNLSHAAIQWVTENFKGNQKEASKKSVKRLLKMAGLSMKKWSASEKSSFQELAPFICMIPGWEKWKQTELRQAVRILKEKGNNEHRFIRLLQQHDKLRIEFLKFTKR